MEAALISALPTPAPGGRARLGALLVRDGHLRTDQLAAALLETEGTGRRLGEVLVERGWIPAAVVARALAEQHGIEFLDLGAIEVDASAYGLLPERFARRYRALPVRFEPDGALLVAVADPTDVVGSDDLRLALGVSVRFAVVAAADLERTLERAYRTHVAVEAADDGTPDAALADEIGDAAAGTESAPAVRLVNQVLTRAIEEGASDVHFEPQARDLVVRVRVDGVMRAMTTIPRALQAAVLGRLKIMGELDIAERRAPQDGRVAVRLDGQPMDLRIAVVPTTHGEQVVLRIMHGASRRMSLAELGMEGGAEHAFARAIRQPYGAVIACGPTGSGKTTTLYAALDVLNDPERVLMTIEDPVEHRTEGIAQIEVNPRAGLTFGRGLRTILRSDPDVLLVGEIRDEETARIAMQAAMTGHLVLTSLHTNNAAAAVTRLKDMGVEPSILGTAINCIVAQRLARRLCLACREAYTPDEDELEALGVAAAELFRPGRCVECADTGYRGRVALYEVMPIHRRIRRLVDASTDEILAAAVEDGMRTLREDGVRLCLNGTSSLDEIRRVTGDSTGESLS